MCYLRQPTIKHDGETSDDIKKMVGFILHGVTHMFEDGMDVPSTYFASKGQQLGIIDTRDFEDEGSAQLFVQSFAVQHELELVGYVAEGWMMPQGREKEVDSTTIESHPDRIGILVLTVENGINTWMMHFPVPSVDGKRQLPDEIEFTRMKDGVTPYPSYVPLMPQQAPAGVLLH